MPSPRPVTASNSTQSPAPDAARTAGRGGLAVLTAKVFFILSGLIQQTLLPRIIGLDGYGALSRVLAIANMANNVVVTSSIQGVSRAVAQTPEQHAGQTLRRTLSTHAAIAIPIALLFLFIAPHYARFQGSPHIVRSVQIVSLVVLAYGLYAPLVGYLNGQRRFAAQAGLDMTYAILRTAGLLGFGYFFARHNDGVFGACIGFALAACMIFPIALRLTGIGSRGNSGPSVREHLLFIAPVAIGQIALQALMQLDIVILGHHASRLVVETGLSGEAAQQAADKIVGVYRACQLFAFLPFQLLIAVTFILFPMLAKAKADGDKEAIATYVRSGMRLALVFACIMVATVAALSPHLLRLAFPAEVGERGAASLRVLSLGQGAFAIFYIQMTVLTSLGRERMSAILTGAAAVIVAALAWVACRTSTTPNDLLLRCAIAVSAALGVAAIAGAFAVARTANAFVRPATALRVMIALAATTVVGSLIPAVDIMLPFKKAALNVGKLLVVPEAIGTALVAAVILLVTREVGKADLDLVKRVIKRKP